MLFRSLLEAAARPAQHALEPVGQRGQHRGVDLERPAQRAACDGVRHDQVDEVPLLDHAAVVDRDDPVGGSFEDGPGP